MTKTEKPGGYEELIFNTEVKLKTGYMPIDVKKISINREEMTSYQFHKKVNEILKVEKSMIEIRLENNVISLNECRVYHYRSQHSPSVAKYYFRGS